MIPSHSLPPILRILVAGAAGFLLGKGEASARQDAPGVTGTIFHEAIVLADDSAPKAGDKVTLKGKLEGGRMAIGGETTGWQLDYTDAKGAAASLEVDVSAIKNAAALDGATVEITGELIAKQYVERGSVLILKASSITKAGSPPAKP